MLTCNEGRAEYILAELKRKVVGMVEESRYDMYTASDILCIIANIEADSVLGERETTGEEVGGTNNETVRD